ncbi:putative 15-hydroxyprostaglandin dehydrogenase (nad(+)) [Diplodia seriata]|uniref:Putative 15-hydroxyprostaglandin dehydrogenase (Nad(+)) n=1 Tax=Diplodia seriata TaxID=420778 RepID=A0A0G2E5C0_9PEZI|nr:putative 15-hydroxyprostaglandin dehydrogenase (nad(+)) [Diplodia seriata]
MASQSHDRVAIVTGATSGIGVDIARSLLTRGYLVALTGRRAELGALVATSLDPSGARARFFACDVSSYASQAALFRAVHAAWGRVDVLIANAGITDKSSVPTPMETVLKGFHVYLDDETGRTGEQMETSGTNIVYYERPAYANGIATEGATTIWEPWFVMGHGEKSGLSGTYE